MSACWQSTCGLWCTKVHYYDWDNCSPAHCSPRTALAFTNRRHRRMPSSTSQALRRTGAWRCLSYLVFIAVVITQLEYAVANSNSSEDLAPKYPAPDNGPSLVDVNGTIECHSGAELVRAFTDRAISLIWLMSDITLMESDWAPFTVPLPLDRHVTVRGYTAKRSEWVLLDFNYIKSKILLQPGAVLSLVNIVSYRARETAHFLAPGLDMIMPNHALAASGTNSSWPTLFVTDSLTLQSTCFPLSYLSLFVSNFERPGTVTSVSKSAQMDVAQPGCVNCTAARPTARCWPQVDIYNDISTYALTLNQLKIPVPAGYIIRVHGGAQACTTMMATECIDRWGSLAGCFLEMFPNTSATPPLWGNDGPDCAPGSELGDAASGLISSHGGQGRAEGKESQIKVAAVIGGVLGGVGLAAVVGALVMQLRQRRKRRYQSQDSKDVPVGENAIGTGGLAYSKESKRWPEPTGKAAYINTSSDCNGDDWQATPGPTSGETPPALDLHAQPADTPNGGHSMDSYVLQEGAKVAIQLGALEGHLTVVSTQTPQRPDLKLGVDCDNEVQLEKGAILGKGACGVVVVGKYEGARVAVKLIRTHGMPLGGAGIADPVPGPKAGPDGKGAAGKESTGDSLKDPEGTFPQLLELLQQEVDILGRCQHPNVVQLLAACLTPPRPCLVMELMETSLDRLMYGKPGPRQLLPLPVVIHIATDIAQGLGFLHPTILHRDLKPPNVLINNPRGARPIAKLSDFGISRLRNSLLITKDPEVGTPPYMAPECFDPLNYAMSHQSDIYSLGVILAEMLVGIPPWQGFSVVQIACKVAMHAERPYALSDVPKARCPQKLARLIEACWETDPRRRPAAAEVVKTLLLVQLAVE